MSLRINQNISAMQGHYYLQLNETNFNTSIERLSSGLRINKAADDPAGLVISEKYRAQVEGLSQAINNARDGIGMVQTAEGALDEMTKLLKSMRNLALHAANSGANDADAIAADQAQIAAEIDSLNKIAERTKFGQRSLLNGSMGVNGVSSSTEVSFVSGTTDTQQGRFEVGVSQAASQGYVQTDDRYFFASTAADAADATFQTGGTIVFGGSALGTTGTITVTIAGTTARAAAVDQINTALADYGVRASIDGSNKISLESDYIGSVTATISADLANESGFNAAATQTVVSTTTAVGATTYATKKLASAETIQFRDASAGSLVSVELERGDSILEAKSSIQRALDENSIGTTVSFNGAKLKFLNNAYGSSSTVQIEIAHSAASAATNLGLTGLDAGEFHNVAAKGGVAGGANGADVAGTIDGVSATGEGLVLTSQSGDSQGLAVRIEGGKTPTSVYVSTTKGELTFQVGAFQNQTVSTLINDLHANRLGQSASSDVASVAAIDVSQEGGAQAAIAVIDAAIAQVSTTRGNLGTFQKDSLESTVRNLGVAKTNLASSESIIRDADMAAEMLQFSKAQILQQTGMAMLAQANSAPQQIMTLFRG